MDPPLAAKNIESTPYSFNQQHQADSGFEKDFPASDRFCSTMERMISQEDIKMLLEKQKEAITKFEKTNETFSRFNALSAARFGVLSHQFANHTRILLEMKKDLDSIFRRIRTLKTKLMKQYGQAFYATAASIQKLEEELGASIESEDSPSKRTQTASKETEMRDETNSTNVAGKTAEQAISQVETDVCENKEKANLENK